MQHPVVRQMQQDRIMGNFSFSEDYEERMADLRKMGAKNWEQPPLPVSPCVRVKATGEIHVWSEFFASRPDLCENCDEQGNTEPSAWRGRSPATLDDIQRVKLSIDAKKVDEEPKEEKPLPKRAEQEPSAPLPPTPPGLCFYPEQFSLGDTQGAVPDMTMASATLGIPHDFTQNYAEASAVQAAMPLSAVGTSNAPVGDAIKEFFTRQNRC